MTTEFNNSFILKKAKDEIKTQLRLRTFERNIYSSKPPTGSILNRLKNNRLYYLAVIHGSRSSDGFQGSTKFHGNQRYKRMQDVCNQRSITRFWLHAQNRHCCYLHIFASQTLLALLYLKTKTHLSRIWCK